ncbi:MAG: FAD:protein FMN transferase [Elusimicrobia bacterium]|nr:FAD:protein FMN transferase [Elusimicrobiota bacterium]
MDLLKLNFNSLRTAKARRPARHAPPGLPTSLSTAKGLRRALAALSLLCPALPLGAASVERVQYLMGTLCYVQVLSPEKETAWRGTEAVFSEIQRLERLLSTYRSDSEISRLNGAAKNRPFSCSRDLYRLMELSQELSKKLGGTFDPTVRPLLIENTPDALAKVGMEKVHFFPKTQSLWLPPGMSLDLGGIGKGYAVDRAVPLLKKMDISSALINFGGMLYALGHPPGKKGWEILLGSTSLFLSDCALSVSGDSQKPGHIKDPRSGKTISRPEAVAVLRSSAAEADALSTGLFVMDNKERKEFFKNHPEISAWAMLPGGKISPLNAEDTTKIVVRRK